MIRKLLLISFFSAISYSGFAQDQNGTHKLAEPTSPTLMAKQASAEVSNNNLVDLLFDFESGYPSNAYYTSVGYEGTGLYGRSSGDSVTVVNAPFQRIQAADTTYLNSYSLKSAAITHGEATNVHFYVRIAPGGGSFQFRYKVSSESGWDFLHVDVDESRLANFSGEIDWTLSPSYTLTEGEHRIDFWYTKDGSESLGMDAAFIDNISIVNADGTPARITKIEPIASATGVDVTLYGTGLSTTTSSNRVYFGDTGYYWYNIAQSPNKMIFRVHENIAPGNYSLTLDNPYGTFTYPNIFTALNPVSTNFESANVVTSLTDEPFDVHIADLNGDGHQDILSASRSDDKIAWYAGNGDGTFGSQITITTLTDGAATVYASDLDNDGDLDVISGSSFDGEIAWYENDGSGNFSGQIILSGSANGTESVYTADLNGDGFEDILSASNTDDKIAWYPNNGDGTFSNQIVISTSGDGPRSVHAADLDGDGDFDVLSASANDDIVSWYENNGDGTFGGQNIISSNALAAHDVYTADLDNDGDLDIISASASDDKIAWYENQGTGSFSTEIILSTNAQTAWHVSAFDLNGDGYQDIISGSVSDQKIAWYQNNTDGTFSSEKIISTTSGQPYNIISGDLDGDGDLDIVSANRSGDQVVWFENTSTPSSTENTTITDINPNAAAPGSNITIYGSGFSTTATENIVKFDSAAATVQSALTNKLTVTVPETTPGFKNLTVTVGTDTAQYAEDFAVLKPNEIAFENGNAGLTGVSSYSSSSFGDVDGDGDLDLLITGYNGSAGISTLYTNDGNGNLSDSGVALQGVYQSSSSFGDVDGDGDLDLLITGYTGSARISTLYIGDGNGGFSDSGVALQGVSNGSSSFADVDGDGDLDLLITGNTGTVGVSTILYLNDGNGGFSDSGVALQGVHIGSSSFGDVDGDGDLDLLITGYDGSTHISILYLNNGNGGFSDSGVALQGVRYSSSSFADVDRDGDLDLLITGHNGSAATSTLYLNDGNGGFSNSGFALQGIYLGSSSFGDVDGDGDLDLFITGYTGSTYTSTLYTGDGNGGFSDSGVVLERVQQGSSTFGDVDGDGDLDLLITGTNSSGIKVTTLYKNTGTPLLELSSIADARQLENGNMVKVRGIITRASANVKKIQQDSSALHMYTTADFNQGLYNANVQAGDSVQVTGTLGEFSGLKELIDISAVEVLSSNNPLPEPISVTLSEVNDFEEFESVLITVENVSTDSTGSEFRFSTNYRISQNGVSSDIDLKLGDQAIIDFEGGTIPDFFNFTGIVNQSSNETPAYSLYPIGVNDIQATLPDNYVYSISEAKALPDSSLVRVRGVATTPNLESSSRTSFFIQDETTGILAYNFGTPIRTIALGDSIEVTGMIETVLGNKQVTVSDINADIIVLNSGNTLPEPQLITFDEYKSAGDPSTDTKELQGTLVRFEQLRTNPALWPSDLNAASTSVNASTLRDSTLKVFLYQGTEVIGYTPPASFDMIGVLHASNGPQIAPRFGSDIIEEAVLSPYDLTANVINNTIELAWEPSPSTNAGGYNIYRSTSAFSDSVNATKLNTTPVIDSTFTDINIVENNSYFYRVAAVDTTTGNVSRLSNSSRVNYKLITIQFASPLAGIPGETIKVFGTNTAGSSLIFNDPITSDSLSLNSRSFIIPDIAPGNYTLSLDFGGINPLPLTTPISVIDSVFGNSGNFTSPTVINNDYASIEKIYAHDLNGDLDLDLIITLNNASGAKIAWLENLGNQEFSTPQVIKSLNSSKTYSISFGDFNKDGSLDIAAVTENIDEKLWFENNGAGTFSQKVIALPPTSGTHAVAGAIEVTSADIDLDGFMDIAISSPADDQIYWYKNTDIDEWTLQGSIASVTDPGNVTALDINDDGDIDFLLTHQAGNTTAIIENNGNGTFSTPLAFNASATQVTDQTTADINSDGKIDVVLISANNSRLDWYPNNLGVFDTQNILSQSITSPSSVSVNDLNGDGHPDIMVGTSAGQILWFENNGTGSFEGPVEIASNLGDISTLISSELTGTGTIDIVAGNTNDGALNLLKNINLPPAVPVNVQVMTSIGNAAISWDANTEPYLAGYKVHRSVSFNSFAPVSDGFTQQTSFTDDSLSNGLSYRYYITAVDTNGNHSLNSDTLSITALSTQISSVEPLSGSDGTIVKLFGVGFSTDSNLNAVHFGETEASTIASDSISISALVPVGLSGSVPISVTSEGFSYTYPAPFRILSTNDGTFIDPVKNSGIGGDANLAAADFNNNGLMDLIVPKPDQNSISIFFSDDINPFVSELEFPVSAATKVVRTANIYGNNYPDIIYITGTDNQFRILKNNGQSTNTTGFMDGTTVSVTHLNPTDIFPADMDNDGFQDIIISSSGDNKISWYKNQSANGSISFGTENVISNSASGVSSIYATDFNNDGRTDVLAALPGVDRVVWYRNEGNGTYTELLIDDGITTPSKVAVADFNNDGNSDVLFNTSGNNEVSLYLNDGTGTFNTFINLSTTMTGGGGIAAGDINGDGAVDVLASSVTDSSMYWFTNNADTTFSTANLISSEFPGATNVLLYDMNGDGNLDISSRIVDESSIGVIPNFQIIPIQVNNFLAGNNNIIDIKDQLELTFNTNLNSFTSLNTIMANAITITNSKGQIFTPSTFNHNENTLLLQNTDYYAVDTLNLTISAQYILDETAGRAFLDFNNNGEFNSGEDDYTSPEFYTTLIGDFNRDLTVNFDDLVLFSDGWRNSDYQYETAPLNFGSSLAFPNARLNTDNNFNIDDLVSFIRYWNYSQERAEQAKAKELASKQNSEEEKTSSAKNVKASKQNYSSVAASEMDYISYEKLTSHNEYTEEQEGIESTYLFSLSHPDSVQALSLSIEYDPENVDVAEIKNLDLFDIHNKNSNVFISRIDSIHGVITLNVANFGALSPIEKRDIASITFKLLNDRDSEITITSDIRVKNKEAHRQVAKKSMRVADELPESFKVSQNYPNPFNPTTTIHYELAEQAKVTLTIYDILGRKVETLINENGVRPGYYKVKWDASRYASGMYLYVVNIRSASGKTHTMSKKMIMVK